jgi:hypothetical protein
LFGDPLLQCWVEHDYLTDLRASDP